MEGACESILVSRWWQAAKPSGLRNFWSFLAYMEFNAYFCKRTLSRQKKDADVAALYGVKTKEVNQAVRNNLEKFPARYMFELTPNELRDLRSKILATNVSVMNRNSTKVFTERGLYMLATILKGERARDITFAIIETFARVRELKRELLDLHKETDKSKQATKMQPTMP